MQVRDRATLYLYQLQRAAEGPDSVDPHWRIPAKGLEAALARYLAAPDTDQPFDLVSQRSADVGGAALLAADWLSPPLPVVLLAACGWLLPARTPACVACCAPRC